MADDYGIQNAPEVEQALTDAGISGATQSSILGALGDASPGTSVAISTAAAGTGPVRVAPPSADGTPSLTVITGNSDTRPNGAPVPTVIQTAGAPAFVATGDGNVGVKLVGQAPVTVIGGAGNDLIVGNHGASLLQAGSGTSTLRSGGGPDTLQGGTGSDTLVGGGQSLILGGSGYDSIVGGNSDSAHDTVYGGSGTEVITFHHGDNFAQVGDDGINYLQAGDGHDTLVGSHGPDTIYGGGTTEIFAGAHNQIFGTGTDSVFGAQGADTITAQAGAALTVSVGNGAQHLDISGSGSQDTVFGGVSHPGKLFVDEAFKGSTVTPDADGSKTVVFADGSSLNLHHINVVFTDTNPSNPHHF